MGKGRWTPSPSTPGEFDKQIRADYALWGKVASSLGLEVHAGHGIDYATVKPIAAIAQIAELNIGHFLIGEAIFVGLPQAIQRMRALMDAARVELAA